MVRGATERNLAYTQPLCHRSHQTDAAARIARGRAFNGRSEVSTWKLANGKAVGTDNVRGVLSKLDLTEDSVILSVPP